MGIQCQKEKKYMREKLKMLGKEAMTDGTSISHGIGVEGRERGSAELRHQEITGKATCWGAHLMETCRGEWYRRGEPSVHAGPSPGRPDPHTCLAGHTSCCSGPTCCHHCSFLKSSSSFDTCWVLLIVMSWLKCQELHWKAP